MMGSRRDRQDNEDSIPALISVLLLCNTAAARHFHCWAITHLVNRLADILDCVGCAREGEAPAAIGCVRDAQEAAQKRPGLATTCGLLHLRSLEKCRWLGQSRFHPMAPNVHSKSNKVSCHRHARQLEQPQPVHTQDTLGRLPPRARPRSTLCPPTPQLLTYGAGQVVIMWEVERWQVEGVAVADARGQVLAAGVGEFKTEDRSPNKKMEEDAGWRLAVCTLTLCVLCMCTHVCMPARARACVCKHTCTHACMCLMPVCLCV